MEAACRKPQHVGGWTGSSHEGRVARQIEGGRHHGRIQCSKGSTCSPCSGRDAASSDRPRWRIRQGILRAWSPPAGDRPPAEPPRSRLIPGLDTGRRADDLVRTDHGSGARSAYPHTRPVQRSPTAGHDVPSHERTQDRPGLPGRLLQRQDVDLSTRTAHDSSHLPLPGVIT